MFCCRAQERAASILTALGARRSRWLGRRQTRGRCLISGNEREQYNTCVGERVATGDRAMACCLREMRTLAFALWVIPPKELCAVPPENLQHDFACYAVDAGLCQAAVHGPTHCKGWLHTSGMHSHASHIRIRRIRAPVGCQFNHLTRHAPTTWSTTATFP